MAADDRPLSAQQIAQIRDDIAKSMTVRQTAINSAIKAAEGKEWSAKDVYSLAVTFHKFVLDGTHTSE